MIFCFIFFYESYFTLFSTNEFIGFLPRCFWCNHTVDCNQHCTVNKVNCPLLKDISFNTVFVGLLWLTSNHMLGSGDFGDKSPLWFLKILKLPLFHSGNFEIFKNALEKFNPNHPSKLVITSTRPFLIAGQPRESIEKNEKQVVWQSKWILKILRQTFPVFLDTEKCAKNISSTRTLYNSNDNDKMKHPKGRGPMQRTQNVDTLGNWFADYEKCTIKTVFWSYIYTLSGLLSNTPEP